MSKNHISFILHKPQLSENIGACARAIKNFNFKKLILINPKPIFPNDKILATSVGAKNIIIQSKRYDTLEQGIGKIDIVIATSEECSDPQSPPGQADRAPNKSVSAKNSK